MAPTTTKTESTAPPACARCGHPKSAHNVDKAPAGCKACQCLIYWDPAEGRCWDFYAPPKRGGR